MKRRTIVLFVSLFILAQAGSSLADCNYRCNFSYDGEYCIGGWPGWADIGDMSSCTDVQRCILCPPFGNCCEWRCEGTHCYDV